MEIETPCKACERVNDDKRNCVAKCPAIMLYRQNSAVCFDKKEFDKINKKLKKLADDHAGQFTEECIDPAEMMSESDEEGETFMADMEIDQDLSDESDIDETPKTTDREEEAPMKKRKYTKKKDLPAEDAGASEAIVLDMSKYPKIARLLKAMSEETMLPQEHIVMSFIGKGLSRE